MREVLAILAYWIFCQAAVAYFMPEMYERTAGDYFFTGMTIVIFGTLATAASIVAIAMIEIGFRKMRGK